MREGTEARFCRAGRGGQVDSTALVNGQQREREHRGGVRVILRGQVGTEYQTKTWVSCTRQQGLNRFMTQREVSGPSL